VRDQILAFLFAGHETTASNIGFTLWKILENPEIEQKVREELQSVLGSEAPSYETLFRLTYLRKVVYEALRLYPAASMFVRQAVSDVEVAGHRFRKGSLFILAPYVIHRRPELWPDPLRFDPDRFNEPPNSGETTRYFAFGAGPRVCIGEQFAVLEAQLVIARLLQTLDLKLVPGEPVRELFRGTLQPSGLTVAVSRRAH
jgi:cytochrome P450